MERQHQFLIRPLAILLLATSSQIALAEDIVSAVNKDEPEPISENGGFFEIGVSLVSGHGALMHARPENDKSSISEITVDIYGSYRYKRAFIEAARSGFEGLNLGFTLWQNERWSVDFLAANLAGTVTGESENPAPLTEAERNASLLERDTLFIAAGTRITRYFDNNRIAQFRLVSDYYDNNGVLASISFGQQWQVGNWSWTGLLGARYASSRFSNYIVGITADEATARFPEYSTNSAVALEAEIGVRYPLTRKLVLASQIKYRAYPGEITDSPLVDEDSDFLYSGGILYVF